MKCCLIPSSAHSNFKRLGLAVVLLILLSLVPAASAQDEGELTPTPSPTPLPPPPLSQLNESVLLSATVFIMQVDDTENGPVITCVGSGTLVSADGLILTNAHIAVEGDSCHADRLVISMSLRQNEPPVPTYVASLVNINMGLDLAVLQINGFLDGRAVEIGSLQLPFVELGDSDQMEVDDTIVVVGYPDIGSGAVQSLRGTISGFTAEARAGDRAWLRTTAPIPGLMAGGGAYNRDGQLIGIPTIAPAVSIEGFADCRSVQDTNGDGQVNDGDTCIPVGGFISALRPSRLARGLVRAATLGIVQGESRAQAVIQPSGQATFSRPFVSTGVNSAGNPVNVVTQLPAGATSLYLFFDYDNMVDGMVYELRASIDGRPNPNFGLPPVTWNGGVRGMWYIGSSGVPWPNGLYQFTLFINGRQTATHQVTVGGAPQQRPAFSDVVFGLQDNTGAITNINYILPETNIVRAQFNFRNMTPDNTWHQIWYLENTPLSSPNPQPWTGPPQGVDTSPAIQSETGLISGRYRVELYIDNALAATSDFVIAGGSTGIGADIFNNFVFATAQVDGLPRPPFGLEFATGIQSLYVFFDWRQLSQRTPWTYRWKVDNDTLLEINTLWAASASGESFYMALGGAPVLPDGTYTFEIEMGGIIISQVNARVGLGRLPVDAFASAEGVILNGRIVDAQTQKGIPGAIFIMLLSEFSVADFLWDNSQILGISLADEEGYFQLPALLQRGTTLSPILYSLLVRADGYLPMSQDGIPVTDETLSPIQITIEMDRD